MRSGPEEARTILLLHIISDRPSKQPLMVCTFLKVYMLLLFITAVPNTKLCEWEEDSVGHEALLLFVSARTNKRHHHHISLSWIVPNKLSLSRARARRPEYFWTCNPTAGFPVFCRSCFLFFFFSRQRAKGDDMG